MRVEADLRQAIRSVAAAAKVTAVTRTAYTEKRAEAVAKFLKTPAGKAVREAFAAYKKAEIALRKAERESGATRGVALRNGLNFHTYGKTTPAVVINNDADFVAAGGVLPAQFTRDWNADQVIAELVAAKEDQKEAILAKFGIIWGSK